MVNTLTSSTHLFIFVFSTTSQMLLGWSDNSQEVLGVEDFEIARDGNIFFRHVYSEDRFQLLNDVENLFRDEKPLRLAYRWLRPDTQELCWLLCRAQPVERDEGTVYEGVIVDISSEIRLLGGELRPSKELFEALETLVLILDSDGRVLYRFVPEDLTGFNFGDAKFMPLFLQPGRVLMDGFSSLPGGQHLYTRVSEMLTGRQAGCCERVMWNSREIGVTLRSLAGTETGQRFIVFARDESALSQSEYDHARVRHAQNFAQFAGGTFHRLNGILQSIAGHAAALQNQSPNSPAVQASSAAILSLVQNSSELTHQLLILKDAVTEDHSSADCNVALMTAFNRVQPLLEGSVQFTLSLGAVPPIESNFTSLVDALELLLRSAPRWLVQHRSYTLQTSRVEISDVTDSTGGLGHQQYCKFSISSINVAAQPRSRSTSPRLVMKTKGMPRSMAASPLSDSLDSIAKVFARCGGTVRHEFTNADGEAVSVYFASHQEEFARPASAEERPQILIIDDDSMVLNTIADFLRAAGHDAVTTDNCKSALALLREHSATLKLVILDAVLATGNTHTLLRQIHRILPDIDIIGFSGASSHELQALMDAGAREVLKKPVNPHELLELVREILDGQRAA